MSQLFENDATWDIISAVLLYLSGAWLRPLVAGLPKTKRLYRVIRFLHRVVDEVDPENDQNTRDSNRQTDSWSDWLTSDQSAVAGDYLDILLPDKTNDYCFELQLDLKTATGCGWYTRYRLVEAGTAADHASAVIGSYSETIYMQANYSVVDVGSLSYLRMTLTGGSGVITHKVIRSRYRRI